MSGPAPVPVVIRRWPPVAAAFSLGTGALALLGWLLEIDVLKSIVPGQVTMKANTALGLMLAGLALICLAAPGAGGRRRRTGHAAVVGVGLLGAVNLGQHLFGADLGIDQLLFDEPAGAVATATPGRMAPSTALAFVLVAAALGCLDLRHRAVETAPALLGVTAAGLALVALLGYASGVISFFGIRGVTQMAVPTAACFIMLGIGVAFARPDRRPMRRLSSDGVGGTVSRRLLPAAIGGPLVLGGLRLAGQDAGLFSRDVGTWLFAVTIVAVLAPLVWRLAGSLERAEVERLRATEAVAAAQEHAAAFEDAPIGAAIVDFDGRFARVNRALCDMVGLAEDDLVGRRVAEFGVPEEREAARELRAALAAGTIRTAQRERLWSTATGRQLRIILDATAITDAEGRPLHLLIQLRDVTEQERARRALEAATVHALERLALAAEYRDDDAGDHTRRVAETAAALAAAVGLDDAEVDLIRRAAPLHDVGKIGIPDAVLLKPGRLTAPEFDLMKTHAAIGADILAGHDHPLLERAAEIARSHHERWDGSGYPDGLAGTAIPLSGRLVAVADVFDALTSDRPYKVAWTREEALDEIERQRGRQFDPEIVDAFLRIASREHDGRPACVVARRDTARPARHPRGERNMARAGRTT